MKRIIVFAALALSTAALAQQPQRPSDEEINARIQALSAQRNAAQDQVAALSAAAETQLRALQAEVERLKKECPAPKKDDKPK